MRCLLILLLLFCTMGAQAQLTIDDCYQKAEANYPMVHQLGLIKSSEQLNLSNASKSWLPQFSLSGKATYQTAVTEIPIQLPGATIPDINKGQWQAVAQINQTIWDGGATSASKEQIRTSTLTAAEQYKVDMYALRGRVNELFFGILLMDAQREQMFLNIKQLNVNRTDIESLMANGMANSVDLDAIDAQLLTLNQSLVQIETSRKAFAAMLSAFTGEKLDVSTRLTTPIIPSTVGSENNRPELAMMEASKKQQTATLKSIRSESMPRFSAFVQGAYGNPGLNMFKVGSAPYAVGGIQLSWSFGALYTNSNRKKIVETNLRNIELQKQTFLFNTDLTATQQRAVIEQYEKIMGDDERIISLRQSVRKASEVKFANGTISASDLVRDIDTEQQAKMTAVLHRVELIKSIFDLKNTNNQ